MILNTSYRANGIISNKFGYDISRTCHRTSIMAGAGFELTCDSAYDTPCSHCVASNMTENCFFKLSCKTVISSLWS